MAGARPWEVPVRSFVRFPVERDARAGPSTPVVGVSILTRVRAASDGFPGRKARGNTPGRLSAGAAHKL